MPDSVRRGLDGHRDHDVKIRNSGIEDILYHTAIF